MALWNPNFLVIHMFAHLYLWMWRWAKVCFWIKNFSFLNKTFASYFCCKEYWKDVPLVAFVCVFLHSFYTGQCLLILRFYASICEWCAVDKLETEIGVVADSNLCLLCGGKMRMIKDGNHWCLVCTRCIHISVTPWNSGVLTAENEQYSRQLSTRWNSWLYIRSVNPRWNSQ